MSTIVRTIAKELGVNENQVSASIDLLDGGSTVPFIARYRKEVTGALDDTQLRTLEDRLRYLREFEDRKSAIVASIESQGKMTDDLRRAIDGADSKSQLEDLYLPYKPKRRTKGMIAIEAGLEPLADTLFQHPETDPHTEALNYLNAEHKIDDAQAALDGAKYILMERFSEHAEVLQTLKSVMWDKALIKSTVVAGQESMGQKFKDYFDYQEAINKVPSHRSLALFRGRTEGILNITLEHSDHDSSDRTQIHPCEGLIAKQFGIQYAGRVDPGTEHRDRAADAWLREVVKWTWRVKLSTHVETDLLSRLREAAEDTAISVFASNLKDLLLAAPAGPKVTIGLDPGLRTGVKVAVVDATGKVLDHTAIYPHAPKNQWDQSIEILAGLARKYRAELLSIGNGTASRETEKLAGDLSKRYPELKLSRIVVSEAGASVYSASEYAAQEFPDLDVTIRGAVSIARRLQDPLSELVKIEPKAIGVGQYQHDVSQVQLGRSLKSVVEDCVNSVGVDLNTASVPLLTHVSGLNQSIASNIVTYRETHGAFGNREQLRAVPRLGDKAFEQCAGFLRIANSDNPLDASAVHPESYALVDQIAARTGTKLSELIGNSAILKGLAANDFSHEDAGALTIQDILSELAKPGRDPRPEFKFASFKEGVESLSDLKPGMLLEGSVTNVTHFGAFVDIGVHQDGLVHISALANRFVKDPRDVVKTGDIVKVKVLEVEVDRKRIALTMKLDQDIDTAKKEQTPRRDAQKPRRSQHSQTAPAGNNAMAAAFAKLKQPS